MNNDWAVVLSALMGRDVSKEIAALAEARAAIGAALNRDQQIFVSANWPSMSLWLASDSGKESARLVVSEWEDWIASCAKQKP